MLTLARKADLAKAMIQGDAKPETKEEKAFVAELLRMSDWDLNEEMEDLQYELTQENNKQTYDEFDLEKLLKEEDQWPEDT